MKRMTLALSAALLLGGLAISCGGEDDSGPINFGFLNGLSGDYSSWGGPSLDGANAAIAAINDAGGVLGRDVVLKIEDNHSTAEGAVSGYNRIRNEIHAMGGVESDGAVALLETLPEDKMPTICPACGTTELDTKGGDYIYRITASDTANGIIAAQLARDLGAQRVATLVQQTEGAQSPARVFMEVWRDKVGGEITASVSFAPGLSSYQTQVQEAFAGEPDVVYIGAGFEAGIPILREYIARGHEATILVSPDMIVPEIAEVAADLPTGRLLAAVATDDFGSPAYETFAEHHTASAGYEPPTGFYETNQYDQYIILALAMTAAGSTDGEAVNEQIPNVVNSPGTKVYNYPDGVAALERGDDIDYDGASSNLQLNQFGNIVSPQMSVRHIVNGEYEERDTITMDPALNPAS